MSKLPLQTFLLYLHIVWFIKQLKSVNIFITIFNISVYE